MGLTDGFSVTIDYIEVNKFDRGLQSVPFSPCMSLRFMALNVIFQLK